MSAATDLAPVNNVLQPLTNGDEGTNLDIKHESHDASAPFKENVDLESIHLDALNTKDILANDAVAKATDSAAEALLLHLEINNAVEVPSTMDFSESHGGPVVDSTINEVTGNNVTLDSVGAKAESVTEIQTKSPLEVVENVVEEAPESVISEETTSADVAKINAVNGTSSAETSLTASSALINESSEATNPELPVAEVDAVTVSATEASVDTFETLSEEAVEHSVPKSEGSLVLLNAEDISDDRSTEVTVPEHQALAPEAATQPPAPAIEDNVNIPIEIEAPNMEALVVADSKQDEHGIDKEGHSTLGEAGVSDSNSVEATGTQEAAVVTFDVGPAVPEGDLGTHAAEVETAASDAIRPVDASSVPSEDSGAVVNVVAPTEEASVALEETSVAPESLQTYTVEVTTSIDDGAAPTIEQDHATLAKEDADDYSPEITSNIPDEVPSAAVVEAQNSVSQSKVENAESPEILASQVEPAVEDGLELQAGATVDEAPAAGLPVEPENILKEQDNTTSVPPELVVSGQRDVSEEHPDREVDGDLVAEVVAAISESPSTPDNPPAAGTDEELNLGSTTLPVEPPLSSAEDAQSSSDAVEEPSTSPEHRAVTEEDAVIDGDVQEQHAQVAEVTGDIEAIMTGVHDESGLADEVVGAVDAVVSPKEGSPFIETSDESTADENFERPREIEVSVEQHPPPALLAEVEIATEAESLPDHHATSSNADEVSIEPALAFPSDVEPEVVSGTELSEHSDPVVEEAEKIVSGDDTHVETVTNEEVSLPLEVVASDAPDEVVQEGVAEPSTLNEPFSEPTPTSEPEAAGTTELLDESPSVEPALASEDSQSEPLVSNQAQESSPVAELAVQAEEGTFAAETDATTGIEPEEQQAVVEVVGSAEVSDSHDGEPGVEPSATSHEETVQEEVASVIPAEDVAEASDSIGEAASAEDDVRESPAVTPEQEQPAIENDIASITPAIETEAETEVPSSAAESHVEAQPVEADVPVPVEVSAVVDENLSVSATLTAEQLSEPAIAPVLDAVPSTSQSLDDIPESSTHEEVQVPAGDDSSSKEADTSTEVPTSESIDPAAPVVEEQADEVKDTTDEGDLSETPDAEPSVPQEVPAQAVTPEDTAVETSSSAPDAPDSGSSLPEAIETVEAAPSDIPEELETGIAEEISSESIPAQQTTEAVTQDTQEGPTSHAETKDVVPSATQEDEANSPDDHSLPVVQPVLEDESPSIEQSTIDQSNDTLDSRETVESGASKAGEVLPEFVVVDTAESTRDVPTPDDPQVGTQDPTPTEEPVENVDVASADVAQDALDTPTEEPVEHVDAASADVAQDTSDTPTEKHVEDADVASADVAQDTPELVLEATPLEEQIQDEVKPAEQPVDVLLTTGAEIERPKSPWMPSFQVTTVGRGITPPDDVEANEPAEASADDATEATGDVETDLASIPEATVPATEETFDDSNIDAHIAAGTPQLVVDTSSLETPAADIARPWTPSYSVHSQGSPLLGPTDLVQEVPVEDVTRATPVQTVDEAELPDMEFATNNEAPVSGAPAPAEELAERLDEDASHPIESLPEVEVPYDGATESHVELEAVPTVVEPVSDDIHVEDVHAPPAEDDVMPSEVPAVPELMLNTSEEVLELSHPEETETSSSHLTPQSEEQRPSSPWVPSYSVNTQGSPLLENATLTEDVPSTSSAPSTEPEPESFQALVEPPLELPVQTPSESIVEDEIECRELPVPAEPLVVDDHPAVEQTVEPSDDDEEMETHMGSFIVEVDTEEGDVQEHQESPHDAASLKPAADDTPEDRPKSPWTPSYSVTMQGPGTPEEEQELDDIEPLPRRSLDEPLHAKDVTLVEVDVPASQVDAKVADVAVDEPSLVSIKAEPTPILALERELQALQQQTPDTAPETVVQSIPIVDTATVDKTSQTTFPTTENADYPSDQRTKLSKLGQLRLAPVDEVEATGVTPVTIETEHTPASARSRLESTTSSRFFPGGWFSTASKVVDEGRTSLEIAQGEFIPVKATPPGSGASYPNGDVSDTPDDASVSSSVAHSDEDDVEEEKERRRWCVVM